MSKVRFPSVVSWESRSCLCASKKHQFILVNGRRVDNASISHAVKEAFHSLLMHEKYPWFVLNLQIDPTLMDCNVHPRKLEVRFVNPQEVHRLVFGAVKHALDQHFLSPILTAAPLHTESLLNKVPASSSESMPASTPTPLIPAQEALFDVKGLRFQVVGQVARSYIVAESEAGLVLIDQHAAHERIRYERLMAALREKKPLQQNLLTPLHLDLGLESQRLLQEHEALFQSMGYDFEPFGGNTYVLRAVPAGLEKKDPERVLGALLEELAEELKQGVVQDFMESLATMTACRGAIKFGDALTLLEMQSLVRDMEITPNATHCPHGRPSIVTFTHDKLETLFKRKNF